MLPLFNATKPIVLASASPRRKDFLTGLGLEFQIVPARAPEPECGPDELPCEFTIRSASFKAREVFAGLSKEFKTRLPVIIGADTVVALGNEVMGKPRNEADALSMLQSLAGRPNTVYTGCACIFVQAAGSSYETLEVCFHSKSDVWMHDFPDEVLRAYVNTGEPMDKAGAYAIQGTGAFLIKNVQGSWTNIVGLPLDELVQVLLENEAIAPNLQR